jgi:hypothetical protein
MLSNKERHLLEGFLFALDLQYNKVGFSHTINNAELASAKFIIQLGELPDSITVNQHACNIKSESLQNFIQTPFKKCLFWQELQEVFSLFDKEMTGCIANI